MELGKGDEVVFYRAANKIKATCNGKTILKEDRLWLTCLERKGTFLLNGMEYRGGMEVFLSKDARSALDRYIAEDRGKKPGTLFCSKSGRELPRQAVDETLKAIAGLANSTLPAKERIQALLNAHPSPLRNLEMMLDQMMATQGDELEARVEQAQTDAATIETARQVSKFSSTPTTQVEEKAQAYKKVEKSRKKKVSGEVKGKDKVSLKKIRRSRKGMRG